MLVIEKCNTGYLFTFSNELKFSSIQQNITRSNKKENVPSFTLYHPARVSGINLKTKISIKIIIIQI